MDKPDAHRWTAFFTTSGAVAAVNPTDLRKVWAMVRDVQVRAGGQHASIDHRMFRRVCSPGADVATVWYRASMLGILQMLSGEVLTPWTHDGELDDAVIQVAASFPMKKMEVGMVQEGPPFDVQEFVRQVRARGV
jgi:hypothetical protein